MKGNFLVALNNADLLTDAELAETSAWVKETLQELSDGSVPAESVPVVPVSTRVGRKAQMLPSARESGADFMKLWNASGIQDVKSLIFERVAPQNRADTKAKMATVVLTQAVRRLQADQDASLALLSAVREHVQNVLIPGIAKTEERLHKQFETRDLGSVRVAFTSLTGSLRSYLAGVGFLKLVLRSDFLASELQSRMKTHSIGASEWQMAYTIGALNEGLYTLYERTLAELSALASPQHPLAAYVAGRRLQEDFRKVIEVLEKQRPPNGVEVDSSSLRKLVATFDQSAEAEHFQTSADWLVRLFLSSEFLIMLGGVFSVYFGVPWAISLPATAVAGTVGYFVATSRWTALQDRFITSISASHRLLEAKLLATYDKDFTRVVAAPMSATVGLLDKAIKRRAGAVMEGKKKAEDLIAEIKSA
ncbi:hypothetical protein DFJ73DRAFT_452170 [Zopfochytrium polystomum]|nr:hypothetical protein DFJ73DRAFT_452170 [Zopfochytrium polystomum]